MTDIPSTSLITVDEAIALLDALPVTPRIETIDLLDADGRVLAEPVMADRDYPAFDKSLVDGYALRAADLEGASSLREMGEIAAGDASRQNISAGECVAIMTGAPLPPGADAVCPVESTMADGPLIRFDGAVPRGRFIERRAAHWRAGESLLAAGVRLTPAGLAVAASVGAARVRVFARPRVGVLSTGNEIVPFDQSPGPSQLRDSNAILITTLLRRLGCEPVSLGHAIDDPALISDRLKRRDLDAICVTGGMSMGRHDYVPAVMRDLGYAFAITKLRMKPGKPFVVATRANAPILFGLPGNPVSGFVCVVRLASRVLRRMQSLPADPPEQSATLLADLPANGPREFYQPVTVIGDRIQSPDWRGSADVLTLARANALIRRAENAPPMTAGQPIAYVRLP